MKLSDIVCFDGIVAQLKSKQRDDVIRELVGALCKSGKIPKDTADTISKAVIKRENEASTGIGKGVAVPHVKSPAIKNPIAAIGCSPDGLDFSSLDKQPVYSVILLSVRPTIPTSIFRRWKPYFGIFRKMIFAVFCDRHRVLKRYRRLSETPMAAVQTDNRLTTEGSISGEGCGS